jgi:hypothetical protein
MRAYDIRRAEVMAEKRRATEAQAQYIQAERERRIIADASGSGPRPPTRSSNPPLSTTPAPEVVHSIGASVDVPSSQVTVPALSRSPVIGTGGLPEITSPSSHSQTLPNKVKTAPAPVSFVPAQTEAGRAVNTDSPLSSTTLASELHPRNVVEASRHSHFNEATRDVQEEIRPHHSRQAAPSLEPHHVQVKREPSVGVLPRSHPQSSPDMEHNDQSQYRQPVAFLRTSSQGMDIDQRAPTSSTSESRATPSHVVQTDGYVSRNDPPGPVLSQDNPHHLQDSHHDQVAPSTDERSHRRQDSASSSPSAQNWSYRDRRSPSPLSSREGRSRSRSPPYWRKRTRSRTPPRFETRQFVDHWEFDRPRVRPRIDDDRDRSWRYNSYDRRRRGDSPRRYRAPPPPRRGYNSYRPSRSPPPSPRHLRTERSPPRRSYYDRSLATEHVPQRFVNTDARERRADEYRPDVNAHHNEPAAEAHRSAEKEEQPKWQQYQRQRRTPSPSERNQTSTPSPRQGEADIGLLDRINMNELDDRGFGRGRVVARGGPNTRRGARGVSSGGRARGGGLGLLSRMSETTTRPTRTVPTLSLSDRMQD